MLVVASLYTICSGTYASPLNWHTTSCIVIKIIFNMDVRRSITKIIRLTIDVFSLCSLHYFTQQTAYRANMYNI